MAHKGFVRIGLFLPKNVSLFIPPFWGKKANVTRHLMYNIQVLPDYEWSSRVPHFRPCHFLEFGRHSQSDRDCVCYVKKLQRATFLIFSPVTSQSNVGHFEFYLVRAHRSYESILHYRSIHQKRLNSPSRINKN